MIFRKFLDITPNRDIIWKYNCDGRATTEKATRSSYSFYRLFLTQFNVIKVSIFSTKSYDRQFFTAANTHHQHELTFLEPRLDRQTACLATNATAVCVFVNDEVDRNTLELLAKSGVNLIALRCAGYNNIDIQAAKALEIK